MENLEEKSVNYIILCNLLKMANIKIKGVRHYIWRQCPCTTSCYGSFHAMGFILGLCVVNIIPSGETLSDTKTWQKNHLTHLQNY